MRNFWVYIIMPLCVIMILFCIFQLGISVGKVQIVREALNNISITDISQAQKELTDFANKQREFYKKTH